MNVFFFGGSVSLKLSRFKSMNGSWGVFLPVLDKSSRFSSSLSGKHMTEHFSINIFELKIKLLIKDVKGNVIILVTGPGSGGGGNGIGKDPLNKILISVLGFINIFKLPKFNLTDEVK